MPIFYKLITAVLALTGCASLFITGEMNTVISISGIALVPGYYRFIKGRKHAPSLAVGALSAATLFVFLFDTVFVSGDVFLAVAHLTVTFQAIKSFDLKEPWDHLQVYFMSLLQLIIASELTRSLTFGAVFILFMILLVTAMVLSHFLKEGSLGRVSIKKPVLYISALTLFATVVFFIAMPRTPYKFIGKSHFRGIRTAGFSDKVDFGSYGSVKLDPTVVMRIEIDKDGAVPYYWRGMTLDYFDGLSWSNTIKKERRAARDGDEFVIKPYDKNLAVEQRIYLEPIDSDIIFGLAEITGVKAEAFSLIVDNSMDVYLRGKASRRINYTAYSVLNESYEGAERREYLHLPHGSERITGLAKSIAAGAETDFQKADLIEQYLKKNYYYSLTTTSPPPGVSPIEDFLFSTKKGYCEHYASSMALMLRGIGVPSRIVNGFYGGEKNEYGRYIIVRQSDAHSWVEAMIDSRWKRFDPTPPVLAREPSVMALLIDSLKLGWSRYVVSFSFSDQRQIVKGLYAPFKLSGFPQIKIKSVKPLLFFIAALAFIFTAYAVAMKLKTKKYGFVTGQYLELRKLLRKKGVRITLSVTAGDLMKTASGHRESLEEFIMLYEKHRFGQKNMDEGHKKRYINLLKRIRKTQV